MKINEHKYLGIGEGLDSDSAPFSVSENSWVNAENVRTETTDAGVTKTMNSIGSNILISQPQPSAVFITIGTIEDEENSRFIKFQFNTTGNDHKIICLYSVGNIEYDVLLSSQVDAGLNFSKYSLIQARIVDGLLYWTDYLNYQCKINIEAAIKLNNPSFDTPVAPYITPIDYKVITLLRRPPLFPLSIDKVTQPSLSNNFISINAFQFSANYHFRDGETSVLQNYSVLAPYNIKTDTYNRIDISFSFSEIIPQDVQQINLAVRYGNTPNFFVINTWDKNNPVDLAAINRHNAGTAPLSYSFYNNQIGIALDSAYSVKPFDSIPVISKTLEIVRDRLFLGNNELGYNSPNTTSLTATLVTQTQGGTTVGGTIMVAKYVSPDGHTSIIIHFLFIVGINPIDYFANPTQSYPNPTDYTTLTEVDGTSHNGIRTYYSIPSDYTEEEFARSGFLSVINAPSSSIVGNLVYKSNAAYRVAVQFYDFGDRKSGVIDNGVTYQTIDRAYDTVTYTTSLNWTLSNDNAINEIPVWATHYAVVRTKCLRTSFFMQAKSPNITYVTKDTSGLYVFNTNTYATTLNGVGIDISSLGNFGMGYIFSDGDIIKIYKTGDPLVYQLRITGQSGNWLIAELQDLGTIGNTASPYINSIFEIFTPYYQSFNETFYEVGEMYAITNPGSSGRIYSVLNDSMRGDVVILQRDGYLTENMSGNDTYYQNWYTDIGRPCFKDTIGQKIKTNSVVWSNVYIPGSNNNGLSSFDALDEKLLPVEMGSLNGLQLTAKVSDQQGLIMLAICVKETASLYMGEVQVVGSETNAFLASSPGVIGTINVLKGSYGTINPEAIASFRGNVYFPDANNGKWIQYSVNGLDVISDYNMARAWSLWFKKFISMTPEEIEAFGCRPFIFTTVDPYHRELLISIPKLSNDPPKGFLPDYPDMIYPFDILDYQAKTVVYKLGRTGSLPHWQSAFTFYAENFITLQNKLYSFHNGLTYLHNDLNSQNNFYGVQYTSKVMVVANIEGELIKVYNNISVQSNIVPLFVYMYCNYPYQQSSDLVDYDFRNLEGVWNATIYRNKLMPTFDGYTTNGLLTGEKMRNTAMFIMLEFNATTNPLGLISVTIGCEISRGNDNQIVK